MVQNKLDLILNELQGLKTEQQDFKMELRGFKTELQSFKQGQQSFKTELQSFKLEQQDMKSQINQRFDILETKVEHIHSDVIMLKTSVDRIDHYVNEDVVAILKTIERN